MNIETLRDYCLSKKAATEDFPFDEVTLVFKVGGKMFGLISLDNPQLSISLKCDPELAIELREQYAAVEPAFHFNKKHWNMVHIDGRISQTLVREWIDHSYDLVVASLTRKTREGLGLFS